MEDERSPSWQVIGASIQGSAHQRTGRPCQDVHEIRLCNNGVLLIAVADGAGSSSLAEQGARCAVDMALSTLSSAIEQQTLPADDARWKELMVNAFSTAQSALQRLADEMDTPLREYATTLTCVYASDKRLVAGQLGDGAVVVRDMQGALFSILHAQRGEYANETFFLTQEQALEQVKVHIWDEPFDALAVMSDGLTRLALKMPSNEPHQPFFQPLFTFTSRIEDKALAQQQLEAFLASERVCSRTEDDKSIVLAVRIYRQEHEGHGEKTGSQSGKGQQEGGESQVGS